MGYLRFEKALMTNLEYSLKKEYLRTNRTGAYASSTIVDCNTRKYHGLLVTHAPDVGPGRFVLLSTLDVSVEQHGALFNLGIHKYGGNVFSPTGHKYIREFDGDCILTTTYRVGGVVLKKELILQKDEDRILLRYTLTESTGGGVKLRFQPYMAFRSVRTYTHENGAASREYENIDNGISMSMYNKFPTLFMQLSKQNEFVYAPDWYRGVEYPKEQERGYATQEDLYVPGYFVVPMRKGESIIFAAGTSEYASDKLKRLFEEEAAKQDKWDNYYHCLKSSAHQFHFTNNNNSYILSGYPWFDCRARDEFIALPGLTLSTGETEYFEECMKTAQKAIKDFIKNTKKTVSLRELDRPDVFLWVIWAIQQYAKHVGTDVCKKKYGKLVTDIIDFIMSNKHPNLELHKNGLVSTNGRDIAMTWMNSSNDNRHPILPRSGYVVEFNALWYNALMFANDLLSSSGKEKSKIYTKTAEKCKSSFIPTFLNEHGYLYDYVDGFAIDWSVRPNMIFAVAFDYSPLDDNQKKNVLDICTRELLTPKGIRSLSPKSGGYNPLYVGPQHERDYAYHQGTAWPWLEGFYLEACLKVYKRSRLSFVQRQIIGFEEEIAYHAIGTIPELFDGNPPFHGRGAYAFAINVAELLRINEIISQFNTMSQVATTTSDRKINKKP
ncbi:MAG: glycogen debranching enzyme N-terminal domain-containing protein [Prevotella sp.]|nr:glycogen debranching enzyme N-terminal domain-containing protein [Candidatus Equicola stercoris]